MQNIDKWLEKHVDGYLRDTGFCQSKAEFRDAAQALVAQAQEHGFTVQQVKVACRGDVETFLMERQNAKIDAETSRRVDEDR
ncbi:hypothetical protein [Pararhizobium arenae]|uniref:hypothetical protein n=1 Tax=Pararhizobium arenae TaxID=1856850 RepID=UPI00094AC5BE|nr:hypothetical protein [Pararhizobium arenae]